jgi:hypothetical protein
MKKILQGLAVAVLATGAVTAHDTTNKTFLMPRPQGVNLPMEITTYKDLIPRKLDDRYGATVAVTPFFQQSADHDETAEYFLFKHQRTVTLRTSTTQLEAADRHVYSDVTNDLDINYLIHDYDLGTNPTRSYSANISLDPEQTVYGARIDYHQNLGSILKNLYLKADMPIVHAENNPKLAVDHVTQPVLWVGSLADDIRNYFEGKFEQRAKLNVGTIDATNLQEKLTKAKILKNSTTGVADIDVALGYKFVNSEKYLFALALATTIPTGNKETGEYMFQAIAGNGRHWGFGADLCASARAWGKINHNIKLSLKMKYRYLFENDAYRTLGINDSRGLRDWGQYHLLLPSNPLRPNSAGGFPPTLIPAANITTLRVDVTPGSQFDGIFDFTYNNGGFNFDLGYNLYYRDREDVDRKQDLPASTYAVASRGFDCEIGAQQAIAHADIDGDLATLWYVDNAHLNTSVAETPSQLTNSIYAGMGYTPKNWDIPLMMGIGGKYEFASNNAVLEQWSVWGKMGVTF